MKNDRKGHKGKPVEKESHETYMRRSEYRGRQGHRGVAHFLIRGMVLII